MTDKQFEKELLKCRDEVDDSLERLGNLVSDRIKNMSDEINGVNYDLFSITRDAVDDYYTFGLKPVLLDWYK